jgi:hypothetical protein
VLCCRKGKKRANATSDASKNWAERYMLVYK